MDTKVNCRLVVIYALLIARRCGDSQARENATEARDWVVGW